MPEMKLVCEYLSALARLPRMYRGVAWETLRGAACRSRDSLVCAPRELLSSQRESASYCMDALTPAIPTSVAL